MPEASISCSTVRLSAGRPARIVDTALKHKAYFPVAILVGGSSPALRQSIDGAVKLFLSQKHTFFPKVASEIISGQIRLFTDEMLRKTFDGHPAVIIMAVETPADLMHAGMVLRIKKQLQSSAAVILVGSRESRERLGDDRGLVFDFFDSQKILPVDRFSMRIEAAIEEWLTSQVDRQRFLSFTDTLLESLNARDEYTAGHSKWVSAFAIETGRLLGFPPHELEHLRTAGLLHDLGKIGIRDGILLKNGRLTDEEFARIREHPATAINMLRHLEEIADRQILQLVLHHHERPDGRGYPEGKMLDDMSLIGWVLPVVDAFDAMTSRRPYQHDPKRPEEALRMMEELREKQFHPQVLGAFGQLLSEGIGIISNRKSYLPVQVSG